MRWTKYTFVCDPDECDTLIQLTCNDFGFPSGVMQVTCPCGRSCQILSVEDATIPPITTTKGNEMETTFGATMTEMSEVDVLKARITHLEERIQQVTQRDFGTSAELHKMRDNMKEFTLEGLDDDSISDYQAEEIASICGFELTNEFEIEVSVQYSITVNARDEESAMNAIYDIDFDSVSFNDDSISYLSSSMDRMEVQ